MQLKPFIINSHGRIVFPGNFFPELDFSVFKTLKQFAAVIRRDFGEKAPTDAEIVDRLRAGEYSSRYELVRDLVLNRFWVNRYTLTMYEKRPIRWGDLPKHREDVFLPVYKPHDESAAVKVIEAAYEALPARWDQEWEDGCFAMLAHVLKNRLSSGSELRPIRPTVAEALANPKNLTRHLLTYDPDYRLYSYDEVIDCLHSVPEMEALRRQSMILHNQYPWAPGTSEQQPIGELKDDDYVIAFYPQSPEVFQFIQRVKKSESPGPRVREQPRRPATIETLALSEPIKPYPPVEVNKQFAVLPRIEAIAAYEGEVTCSNDDLIRNHAYCWSRMTAAEISEQDGNRGTLLHRDVAGGNVAAGGNAGDAEVGTEAGGDRCCPVLQLHEYKADSIGCDVALRRAGAAADAHFVRHHRRLRGYAIRNCGGDPASAGN